MTYEFNDFKQTAIISGHLRMGECNPYGEEITVNSLYLERNHKPFIPVMGEYHFCRDRKDNWYKELCKMKAGGVTIVGTYVFWIYHEEVEGEFDFTGDLDLNYFLSCAKRAGLSVCLRIGPWAHGECRNGGFPDWLVGKGFLLRENNDAYMHYVRIFYERIYEEVKDYLYDKGGNIVAIQFENELVDSAEHLLALKELALSIGYHAPIYTVTGWNNIYGARIPVDEVLPVFSAYVEAPWAESIKKLPLSKHYAFDPIPNDCAMGMDLTKLIDSDGWRLPYERYPFATCELGAGLQMTHHRRVIVTGMDVYAMSLVKLGCGNNLIGYYMYHGGNNKIGKLSTFEENTATGYPNNLTVIDYDFQTCISSYGEARDQYELLNILHLFAADQEESLARMEHVPAKVFIPETDLEHLRYCMRTDGHSGFIFVNHYQRQAKCKDLSDVIFTNGDVTFPALDVKGDTAFVLPFHLECFKWATAQYLCKQDDTYFFMEIPGIKPQFCLESEEAFTASAGEILEGAFGRIVVLSMEEARKLRRLDGKLYMGTGVNLYLMDGKICSIEDGDFSYRKWEMDHFSLLKCKQEDHSKEEALKAPSVLTLTDCDAPFALPYPDELQYGYPESPVREARRIRYKKLSVNGSHGFVEILEDYDTAQIYADGKLIADHFYCGLAWRLPGDLLYGKECYLVMSERRDDIYLEDLESVYGL